MWTNNGPCLLTHVCVSRPWWVHTGTLNLTNGLWPFKSRCVCVVFKHTRPTLITVTPMFPTSYDTLHYPLWQLSLFNLIELFCTQLKQYANAGDRLIYGVYLLVQTHKACEKPSTCDAYDALQLCLLGIVKWVASLWLLRESRWSIAMYSMHIPHE